MSIDTKMIIGYNLKKCDDTTQYTVYKKIHEFVDKNFSNKFVRNPTYKTNILNNHEFIEFMDGEDKRSMQLGWDYSDIECIPHYQRNFYLSLGCWGNSKQIIKDIGNAILALNLVDYIAIIPNDSMPEIIILKS